MGEFFNGQSAVDVAADVSKHEAESTSCGVRYVPPTETLPNLPPKKCKVILEMKVSYSVQIVIEQIIGGNLRKQLMSWYGGLTYMDVALIAFQISMECAKLDILERLILLRL